MLIGISMGVCLLKVWKEVPFSQIGRGPLRPPGPESLDSGKPKRVLSVNEAGAVLRLPSRVVFCIFPCKLSCCCFGCNMLRRSLPGRSEGRWQSYPPLV